MPPNPNHNEGRTFRLRYVGAFLVLLASILIGMLPALVLYSLQLLLTTPQV